MVAMMRKLIASTLLVGVVSAAVAPSVALVAVSAPVVLACSGVVTVAEVTAAVV